MTKFLLSILILFMPLLAIAQETEQQKATRRKTFIEDFLRTYEAAYEKKQIDYIFQFFSSDALIITETKQLLKHGAQLAPKSKKKRQFKLIVEDKKEYIKRLTEIFKKNISIKLSISGKYIERHPKYSEIYGVYFTQMWNSSDDTNNIESQMPGYVFLLIDFKNRETQPIIHVRTWQPKSNIKSPKDKFSIIDFPIYDF